MPMYLDETKKNAYYYNHSLSLYNYVAGLGKQEIKEKNGLMAR